MRPVTRSPLATVAAPRPVQAQGAAAQASAPATYRGQADRTEFGPLEEGVPADFGAKNGAEVSNKATILSDLWKRLGHDRPPAVALIYVEPMSLIKGWSGESGSGTNPFGHVAIAFTPPGGKTTVMNIAGGKGRMVNFLPLEDYLFSTDFDAGGKQGGAYNRHMEMVAVWDWPADKLAAMQRFYEKLDRREQAGDAKFSLLPAYLRNFVGRLLPGKQKERGNCARWTSLGMVEGGLRTEECYWPKKVAMQMVEQFGRKASVIDVPRITQAVRTYGADVDAEGLLTPLRALSGQRFDLDQYADARLVVPEGSTRVEIELPQAR